MDQATSLDRSKSLTALYPVVAVDQPTITATEFRRLFPLETVFETDWYVHLKSPDGRLQIGFVRFDHESVPAADRNRVQGTFVTLDADDVAALWEEVKADLVVVLPLTDESWGQRHFIARLPGGVLVDIVQLLPQD